MNLTPESVMDVCRKLFPEAGEFGGKSRLKIQTFMGPDSQGGDIWIAFDPSKGHFIVDFQGGSGKAVKVSRSVPGDKSQAHFDLEVTLSGEVSGQRRRSTETDWTAIEALGWKNTGKPGEAVNPKFVFAETFRQISEELVPAEAGESHETVSESLKQLQTLDDRSQERLTGNWEVLEEVADLLDTLADSGPSNTLTDLALAVVRVTLGSFERDLERLLKDIRSSLSNPKEWERCRRWLLTATQKWAALTTKIQASPANPVQLLPLCRQISTFLTATLERGGLLAFLLDAATLNTPLRHSLENWVESMTMSESQFDFSVALSSIFLDLTDRSYLETRILAALTDNPFETQNQTSLLAVGTLLSATDLFGSIKSVLKEQMERAEAGNKAKAQELLHAQRAGTFHLPELIGAISSLREKQLLVTQIKTLLFKDERVSKLSEDLEKMRRALLSKFLTNFRSNLAKAKKILDNKTLASAAFSGGPGIDDIRDTVRDTQVLRETKAVIPNLAKEYGLSLDTSEGKVCQRAQTFYQEHQEVAKWRQSYQDLLDKNSTQKLALVIDSLRHFESLVTKIDAENHKKCLGEVSDLYQEILLRLSQATQIETEVRTDLARVEADPSSDFGFVGRCFQIIQRTSKIQTGDPSAVSSFRIYLQHQLLKVVFAQTNTQLQRPVQFLQRQGKLQLQLRHGHANRLCLHPSFPDIRELWYRKMQEVFVQVSDAAHGFDERYVRYLTKKHLGESIAGAYCAIEETLDRLRDYLDKEISFEFDTSVIALAEETPERLDTWTPEQLAEKAGVQIRRSQLARKLMDDVRQIPESYQFETHIHIDTTYFKGALLEKIGAFGETTSRILKEVTGEALSRSRKVKEAVAMVSKGAAASSLDPLRLHELMKNLGSEKSKVQFFVPQFRETLAILGVSDVHRNFCKLLSFFLNEWEALESVQVCTPEQMAKLDKEITTHLQQKSTAVSGRIREIENRLERIRNTARLFELGSIDFTEGLAKATELQKDLEAFERLSADYTELRECFRVVDMASKMADLESDFEALAQELGSEALVASKNCAAYWHDLAEKSKVKWRGIGSEGNRILVAFLDEWAAKATSKPLQAVIASHRDFAVRFLVSLSGEGYSAEDWYELLRLLGIDSSPADLTCRHLFEAENLVREKLGEVKALNSRVVEQRNIRGVLQEIAGWRESAELTFLEHRVSNGAVLSVVANWDELFEGLADNTFQLQIVSDSRLREMFSDQLELLKIFFGRSENQLGLLRDLQRRLLHLDPIFAKSKLTVEVHKEFEGVRSRALHLLNTLKSKRFLSKIASDIELETTLRDECDKLAKLQLSLQRFLDEKRSQFCRLYLLGDEDLIELLAASDDARLLRLHLKKLYPAIEAAEFDKKGRIAEVISETVNGQREHLTLASPIAVQERDLATWLAELKSVLKETLRRNLAAQLQDKNAKTNLLADVTKHIGSSLQTLFLFQELRFSVIFSEAISRNDVSGLVATYTELVAQLSHLQTKNRDNLEGEKYRQLIMFVVKKVTLLKEIVNEPQNFAWKVYKTMTYSWVMGHQNGPEAQEPLPEVRVHLSQATLPYSWEYQGIRAPLVYTEMTDRIFLTISQCFRYNQSTNLTGPAGTGKTETAKFFGYHVGRNVLIFNCDETINGQTLLKIFRGFVSEHTIACFDEFNRLNQSQLSVASQIIQAVQSFHRSKGTVTPSLDLPPIDLNSALFVTMNPKMKGYGARFVLPQNLKNMFRVVNVSNPAEKTVFEVLIFAEGCPDYESLADQLIAFFQKGRQLFSKQRHYDWSLRKVKSVIAAFRTEKNSSSKLAPNSIYCLLKSLETNVFSILEAEDITIYSGIVREIFGEHLAGFEKAKHLPIPGSASLNSQTPTHPPVFLGRKSSWLSQKLAVFVDLLAARDQIFIFGPPKMGKSLLWRAYLALNPASTFEVINPCFADRKAFLGFLNEEVGTFVDGVLTQSVRAALREAPPKNGYHFIVFDAEVDPEWIESLNSMLDDNRLLSLPNGERIKVPAHVKFIFETRTIHYASPATLSRMGVLNLTNGSPVSALAVNNPQGLTVVVEETLVEALAALLELASKSSGAICSKADHSFSTSRVFRVIDQAAFQGLTSRLASKISRGHPEDSELQSFIQDFNALVEKIPLGDPQGQSSLRHALFNSFLEGLIFSPSTPPVSLPDVAILTSRLLLTSEEFETFAKTDEVSILRPQFSPSTIEQLEDPTPQDPSHLAEALLASHKPIILSSPDRQLTADSLAALQNSPTGQAATFLHVSCTFNMKQAHLLAFFKENFRITEKRGQKWAEPNEARRQTLVCLHDFDTVGRNQYGVAEVHEAVYHLLVYGYLVDAAAHRIYLSDNIRLIMVCNKRLNDLVAELPLKLARLGSVHCPSDQVDKETAWDARALHAGRFKTVACYLSDYERFKNVVQILWTVAQKVDEERDETGLRPIAPGDLAAFLDVLESIAPLTEADTKQAIFLLIRSHCLSSAVQKETAIRFITLLLTTLSFQTEPLSSLTPDTDPKSRSVARLLDASDYRSLYKSLVSMYSMNVSQGTVHLLDAQRHLLGTLLSTITLNLTRKHLTAFYLFNGRGSGRKLAIHLFSIATDREVVTFTCSSRVNCHREFSKTLLKIYQDVIMDNKRVTLVVPESQVATLEVFDDLLCFLKLGIFPGFGKDEIEKMVKKRADFGAYPGSVADFSRHILATNFAVFFVADGTRYSQTDLLQKYPSILSELRLVNCDIFCSSAFLYEYTRQVWAAAFPGSAGESLSTSLRKHQAFEAADRPDGPAFQHLKACTDLSSRIHSEKEKELKSRAAFLELGVTKLLETEKRVKEMAAVASKMETEVIRKSAEAERALQRISEIYQGSQDKRSELEAAEIGIAGEEEKIKKKQAAVEAQLLQVLPILEEAKKSVRSVSRSNIDELRMLKNVPEAVVNVFTALLKLMDFQDVSFGEAKKLLAKKSILDEISALDFRDLSRKNYDFVRKFVSENPKSFDGPSICYVSQAAGPIAEFVKALVRCKECHLSVEPLDREKAELQAKLADSRAKAERLKKGLSKVDVELEQQKAECTLKMGETELHKKELRNIQERLVLAQKLVDSLAEEKTRWGSQLAEIHQVQADLPAFSYLAAVYLVKHFAHNDLLQTATRGPSDPRETHLEELTHFYDKIQSILVRNGPFDEQKFLAGDNLTHEMVNNGLSSNRSLATNVSSVLWSQRTVLLVDPSDVILTFLRTSRLPEAINVSAKDKSLFQKLTLSLRLGKTLILEDFSADFPPFLAPVIQKAFIKRQSEVWEVEIGGKSFQVSSQFRLIVHNRFSEDLSPALLGFFDVIDNSYKRQTLETHFVDFIMGIRNPEVLGKRLENLKVQKVASSELRQLEADILEKVKTIDESLLENESLIRSLQITKAKSLDVEKNLEELKKIGETLAQQEQKYAAIGSFLAQVFLFLEKLPKINPFYRFSLGYFCQIVQKSMAKSSELGLEKPDSSPDLAGGFAAEFCGSLFRETCSAFRTHDRVYLSLLLLIADGRLGITEVEAQLLPRLVRECAGGVGADDPTRRLSATTLGLLEQAHQGLVSKFRADFFSLVSVVRPTNSDKEILLSLQKKFAKREILIILAILEPARLPSAIQDWFEGRFGKLWGTSGSHIGQLRSHLAEGEGHVVINCLGGADPTAELATVLRATGPGVVVEELICSEDSLPQTTQRIHASQAGVIVLKNFHLCPRLADDLLPLAGQAKKDGRALKFVILTEDVSILSTNFLAQSFKVTFEKTDRLAEIMRKNYDSLPAGTWDQIGIEKANLLFTSCHLHAQFCLREQNLGGRGWAKPYEFGWLEFANSAQFFADLNADKPEDFLRIFQQMLIHCLYGSKVDDLDDRGVMANEVMGTVRLEHSRGNILPNSTDVRLHHALFDQLEKTWEARATQTTAPAIDGSVRADRDSLARGLDAILTK